MSIVCQLQHWQRMGLNIAVHCLRPPDGRWPVAKKAVEQPCWRQNRFWYETFRPPETCTMSMCVQWMYQRPEISVRRNAIKHILSFAASIIMCDHKTDKNRHLSFSGKLVSRSNCVVGSSVNRESGILRGYYAVKWTQCARKSSEYRPMIRARRSMVVQFAIERTREGIGAGRSSISSGGWVERGGERDRIKKDTAFPNDCSAQWTKWTRAPSLPLNTICWRRCCGCRRALSIAFHYI